MTQSHPIFYEAEHFITRHLLCDLRGDFLLYTFFYFCLNVFIFSFLPLLRALKDSGRL